MTTHDDKNTTPDATTGESEHEEISSAFINPHKPLVEAINWNRIDDSVDLQVWNRLTKNFWLPEATDLASDLTSWHTMSKDEQDSTIQVFAGLTLLDTIQGFVGAPKLSQAARTPHEEAVYGNITFMEALAGGTELLTPSGWKDVSEIGFADKVAQYDPNDNSLSFVNPVAMSSHHADEVYEISTDNGNGRQVVSGGHRVYLEEKEHLSHDCEDWTYRVLEARELADVNLDSGFRRFRATGQAATGRSMDAKDRLLVAIQADGSIDNVTVNSNGEFSRSGARSGTIPVRFSFAKARKVERMRALAEEAGWQLVEGTPDNKGRTPLRLMVPVERIGDRQKHFDAWYSLDEFGVEMARAFVEELGHWDAHTQKGGTGITYYTVDKRNSDFVVAVAALAGYRSRTTVRKDDRSDSYNDTYVTNILLGRDTYGSPSMSVKRVEGRHVYCIQVPSTFLLTRNGESTVVTGNCVHAKSYSSIFATLISEERNNEAFRFARENEMLQNKARIVLRYYYEDDFEKMKIASTLLESFLFYSGFFMPLWWSTKGKLTRTADIIRLIIRDESIHGFYIGYKFQLAYKESTPERQEELRNFAYSLMEELYENEIRYTEMLYDDLGLTEDVKCFLRYNANKAFMNLGLTPPFKKSETDVPQQILSSLNPIGDENHDFFSGSGSSYVIGESHDSDDVWDEFGSVVESIGNGKAGSSADDWSSLVEGIGE